SFTHVQRERNASLAAALFEQPGSQAFIKEAARRALIDQELAEAGAILHKRAGVIGSPSGFITAQIALESLARPTSRRRLDNRREGRATAIAVRMLQGDRQGAMAAHRMAEN